MRKVISKNKSTKPYKKAEKTVRKKYQRVDATQKDCLIALILKGLTIKEAAKITDIGYENAKAIKKAYDKNKRLGITSFEQPLNQC